jgi:hypothetical protein
VGKAKTHKLKIRTSLSEFLSFGCLNWLSHLVEFVVVTGGSEGGVVSAGSAWPGLSARNNPLRIALITGAM